LITGSALGKHAACATLEIPRAANAINALKSFPNRIAASLSR
jgi:hypothetical protein